MILRKILCVSMAFLLVTFATGLGAQSQPTDDSERFQQALNLFRSGNYDRAALLFREVATETPPGPYASASHVMLARSLYRLGRVDEAGQTLRAFLSRYPESRYVTYARYLLAACLLRGEQWAKAVRPLLEVEVSGDTTFSGRAHKALVAVLTRLDEEEVERIARELRDGRQAEALELAWLEALLQQGRLSTVIDRAAELRETAKSSDVRQRAEKLAQAARILQRSHLRVGVILPLSGYYEEQGRSLLRGIQFALKRNRPGGTQVELVVRDSESRLLRAIKEAKQLIRDERVVALIGELEGDKSVAIGAIAAMGKLPTIVPVSSLTGVASVGNTVFQLNMDLEHRARVLAEYAVEEIGCRNFAILAPADDYGIEMSDAFATRVDELGGNVVAQEWYYENAQDLSKQFKKIRELGFLRFIADTLAAADTSGSLPSRDQVDSVWQALNDTLKAHAEGDEPDNLVEAEDIPVYGIDAIFFPVYKEDIPYVAPQFARFNIRAKPLGGGNWYDEELLRENGRYVDSLIFVTDWFLDQRDPLFRQFRDEFRLQMGADPDRWAAYGYDAMTLILKAIAEGATTRGEILEALERMENVAGIRGVTSFRNRVNGEINLVRYTRGRFERIEWLKATEQGWPHQGQEEQHEDPAVQRTRG